MKFSFHSFYRPLHMERCHYVECGKEFPTMTKALYCCVGHQEKQALINMRQRIRAKRAKENAKSVD